MKEYPIYCEGELLGYAPFNPKEIEGQHRVTFRGKSKLPRSFNEKIKPPAPLIDADVIRLTDGGYGLSFSDQSYAHAVPGFRRVRN